MIELDEVRIELPGFAVRDVSLAIETGEFFALIGPTGAGKSVLLEAVAGLIPLAGGRIRCEGRDITDLAPEKRDLGIVYQDHALFPHLSVRDNITFGPRVRRNAVAGIRRRLDRLAGELSLGHILDRSIHALSGGERQRVALARALIVDPSVLVLDEPLSSLDPRFRFEVHQLLQRLHREQGITFIIVSHDFDEVLYLAQRVALMNQGRIVQVGPSEEVFRRPRTPFAADFVGMGNVFAARFDTGMAHFSGLSLPVADAARDPEYVAVRPEDVILGAPCEVSAKNGCLRGIVDSVIRRGAYLEVRTHVGAATFICHVPPQSAAGITMAEGAEVGLVVPTGAIHTF